MNALVSPKAAEALAIMAAPSMWFVYEPGARGQILFAIKARGDKEFVMARRIAREKRGVLELVSA